MNKITIGTIAVLMVLATICGVSAAILPAEQAPDPIGGGGCGGGTITPVPEPEPVLEEPVTLVKTSRGVRGGTVTTWVLYRDNLCSRTDMMVRYTPCKTGKCNYKEYKNIFRTINLC